MGPFCNIAKISSKTFYPVCVISGICYTRCVLNPVWVVLLSKGTPKHFLQLWNFSKERYIRYTLQLIKLIKPVTSLVLNCFSSQCYSRRLKMNRKVTNYFIDFPRVKPIAKMNSKNKRLNIRLFSTLCIHFKIKNEEWNETEFGSFKYQPFSCSVFG